MKLNKSGNKTKIILTGVVALLLFNAFLFSNPGGFVGRTSTSTNGCGSCHGNSSSGTVTVGCTSESGSWVVNAGATVNFSVTVGHPSLPEAGVNIAVKTDELGTTNAGSLLAGAGLRISSGELTHSTPPTMNGGSVTFNFTWVAPTTPGTYYLRAIGMASNNNGNDDSGDLWNWMTPKAITVVSAGSITLTSPVGGENWCSGISQNITWNSTAVSTVKIELSNNGGTSYPVLLASGINASTGSWTWNIPSGQAQAVTYRVKVTSEASATVFNASTSNFSIGNPTAIVNQPTSLGVCVGGMATFSVNATGLNLNYSWRKDGVAINGANQKDYTIDPVGSTHGGSYDCIVSGACGSQLTSSAAVLTVQYYPQVSADPQAKEVCEGEAVSFSVTASGTDLTYIWRKNSIPIPSATSSTYNINSAALTDIGNYDVIVNGKCPSPDTSAIAALRVNIPPKILVNPISLKSCDGINDFIFVNAIGTNLKYKWRKNDVEIANSDNDTLFFTPIDTSDAGIYQVSISGTCLPDVASNSVPVQVTSKPMITVDPMSYVAKEGTDITFKIEFKGLVSFIQWRKNGIPITGAYYSSLSLVGVRQIDSGYYDCVIKNDCGYDTSLAAKLTINSGTDPILSLSDLSISFNNVLIGQSRDTTVRKIIKNTGSGNLIVTEIKLVGPNKDEFTLNTSGLPLTIPENKTEDFAIRFTPIAAGDRTSKIQFTSNSVANPELDLAGFGAFLSTSSDTNQLFFAVKDYSDSAVQTLIIYNKGNIPADIALYIQGNDPDCFSIQEKTTFLLIPPNSSKNVLLMFRSLGKDNADAVLMVRTLLNNESFLVALNGKVNPNAVVQADMNKFSFKAYPNPSGNDIVIEFSDSESGGILEFYDAGANKLCEYKIEAGQSKMIWNSADIQSKTANTGLIYIQLRKGNIVERLPILMIK